MYFIYFQKIIFEINYLKDRFMESIYGYKINFIICLNLKFIYNYSF